MEMIKGSQLALALELLLELALVQVLVLRSESELGWMLELESESGLR